MLKKTYQVSQCYQPPVIFIGQSVTILQWKQAWSCCTSSNEHAVHSLGMHDMGVHDEDMYTTDSGHTLCVHA
jgi:hypothetical protein